MSTVFLGVSESSWQAAALEREALAEAEPQRSRQGLLGAMWGSTLRPASGACTASSPGARGSSKATCACGAAAIEVPKPNK